ncbi:MAG: hypothetical protein M1828_002735 [Chrysothrix sp. TS-e1954]|nr:MAG: hypothetical protein M1828_002735 [Chrysothrix sp. TS-e1954]
MNGKDSRGCTVSLLNDDRYFVEPNVRRLSGEKAEYIHRNSSPALKGTAPPANHKPSLRRNIAYERPGSDACPALSPVPPLVRSDSSDDSQSYLSPSPLTPASSYSHRSSSLSSSSSLQLRLPAISSLTAAADNHLAHKLERQHITTPAGLDVNRQASRRHSSLSTSLVSAPHLSKIDKAAAVSARRRSSQMDPNYPGDDPEDLQHQDLDPTTVPNAFNMLPPMDPMIIQQAQAQVPPMQTPQVQYPISPQYAQSPSATQTDPYSATSSPFGTTLPYAFPMQTQQHIHQSPPQNMLYPQQQQVPRLSDISSPIDTALSLQQTPVAYPQQQQTLAISPLTQDQSLQSYSAALSPLSPLYAQPQSSPAQLPQQSSAGRRSNRSSASSSNGTRASTRKTSHPCPLAGEYNCKEHFTTSGHAARHAKKHTGKKDARCPECEKAFTRKDNMEQHRKTHGNVKVVKSAAATAMAR